MFLICKIKEFRFFVFIKSIFVLFVDGLVRFYLKSYLYLMVKKLYKIWVNKI